ncbi:unnamed protein product, partial [Didymodactylos carnosus]
IFVDRDYKPCTYERPFISVWGWVCLLLSVLAPLICNQFLTNHLSQMKRAKSGFALHIRLTCMLPCISMILIHVNVMTAIFEYLHVTVMKLFIDCVCDIELWRIDGSSDYILLHSELCTDVIGYDHIRLRQNSNSEYLGNDRTLEKNENGKLFRGKGNEDVLLLNNDTSHPSFGAISTIQQQPLQQARIVSKHGDINLSRRHIKNRKRQFLADIFITLIDLKWSWIISLFVITFIASWVLFAIIWSSLMYFHGDFAFDKNINSTSCIQGVHTLAGVFLFSLETQQTIGYGTRSISETCPGAILILILQALFGLIIQAFLLGLIYTKLSRPKKRSETLMWSHESVICMCDGHLSLQVRLGDMRNRSNIVEAHVRMYFVQKRVTQEGEVLPLHLADMNVGFDKGEDRLFLIWPLIIEHRIDQNSPLWTMSKEDLTRGDKHFEVILILEGIIEPTGMTTQARTSYLPSEIKWGHRFERLIDFNEHKRVYEIDYSKFHVTYPLMDDAQIPSCSAKELYERRKQNL